MVQLFPISGSKIFIGSVTRAKSTVTEADFAGVTWTEIDGWANAGQLGDTVQLVEQEVINASRVRKAKGTRNANPFENQFLPDALDPGQRKFNEATDECRPYKFKVEWGAACSPSADVTVSVADPAVVTWDDHGFVAGQPIMFDTEGTLPTGLVADTLYYVIPTGLTANTFSVSATSGGAAVAVTVAGTGVIVAKAPPVGMTDFFFGLAMPGARSGGTSNTAHLRSWSIAVDSNILEL